MNRHRILQGTALTTAVALGAGYVWWAHYQASAHTSATHPETPPPAQEQSPESVEFASPIFHANGMALSSKSLSMPVFNTRQDGKETSTAPIEKQEAQVFNGFGIISGSKSFGRPIDISIPEGKASDLTRGTDKNQVSLPPSDDTVPRLLRRPEESPQ